MTIVDDLVTHPSRCLDVGGWGVLEDGTYDAFIVDVTTEGAVLHLDLTILAGPHKGEVISVRATGLEVDEIDAIGMPATVTVTDGQPSVTIDDV